MADWKRKHRAWRKKVNEELPALAAKVFSYRRKFYNGCGFHWSLEKSLGSLIREVNNNDDPLTLEGSILLETLYEDIKDRLARIEMIDSHYDWLNKHLPAIIKNLNLREETMGAIVGDGDKCWSWQTEWKEAGIPFPHGVAMYILSKCRPYSQEVRDTKDGWVPVYDWIVKNYERFKPHFPTEDLEYWTAPKENKQEANV